MTDAEEIVILWQKDEYRLETRLLQHGDRVCRGDKCTIWMRSKFLDGLFLKPSKEFKQKIDKILENEEIKEK